MKSELINMTRAWDKEKQTLFNVVVVLTIFGSMSLHCKLVPVQYREYEFGLLKIGPFPGCLEKFVKNGRDMNDLAFYHRFPGSCGVSSLGNSRVIGGDDAKPGAWPWQVCELIFSNSLIIHQV